MVAYFKDNSKPEPETKMLGGQIDAQLYWAFKKAAAERKETMQEALTNAVLLYLDIGKKATEEKEKYRRE